MRKLSKIQKDDGVTSSENVGGKVAGISFLLLFLYLFGCPQNGKCPECKNVTYVWNVTNVTNITYILNVTNVTNVTCVGWNVSSFTCADVDQNFYWLTRYHCYWATRDKYGFGKYYDVATGCISLGLPEVCECYWSIPEFVGVSRKVYITGYGVVG